VALSAGESVSWREEWYPVAGTGGIKSANEHGALDWALHSDGVAVGFYPVRPFTGAIVAMYGGDEIGRLAVAAAPDAPFTGVISFADRTPAPAGASLELRVLDETGAPLLVAD
jgi:hypothetical protein